MPPIDQRASVAIALGLAVLSASAHGAQIVWIFDTPATASGLAVSPSVATLTLEDVSGGVRFTLDPNESNTGWTSGTYVESVRFIYNPGPALTGGALPTGPAPQTIGSFTWTAGTPAETFSLPNGTNVAGYSPIRISVEFPTGNSENRFVTGETSSFTISGVTLANFGTPFAEASGKPGPITSVLSLNSFAGTSSNWVAMAPVPEPEEWAMMIAGLGIVGLIARKRRQSQV